MEDYNREGQIRDIMASSVEAGEIVDLVNSLSDQLEKERLKIERYEKAALPEKDLWDIKMIYQTQIDHGMRVINLNVSDFKRLLANAEATCIPFGTTKEGL